ncbi:hypothetical protein [Virgibacillus ndiopensis]|uniref:hypothetical protein n=1 Tax=Virgibacillus ndiopensis TaxID=2004408 RepID=UPI000C07606B|nr:hypothetical protein [Virgibacillus ndiopensis]
MRRWREKRKQRKQNKLDQSSFWNILVDILLWIPELLLLPFRLILWLARGFLRLIGNIFDYY